MLSILTWSHSIRLANCLPETLHPGCSRSSRLLGLKSVWLARPTSAKWTRCPRSVAWWQAALSPWMMPFACGHGGTVKEGAQLLMGLRCPEAFAHQGVQMRSSHCSANLQRPTNSRMHLRIRAVRIISCFCLVAWNSSKPDSPHQPVFFQSS